MEFKNINDIYDHVEKKFSNQNLKESDPGFSLKTKEGVKNQFESAESYPVKIFFMNIKGNIDNINEIIIEVLKEKNDEDGNIVKD